MARVLIDRKSTRLNSSHLVISYAVFCLKKKRLGRARLPESLTTGACGSRRFPSWRPTHALRPTTDDAEHHRGVKFASSAFFFFNDTATPEIYPLSLHDALPI